MSAPTGHVSPVQPAGPVDGAWSEGGALSGGGDAPATGRRGPRSRGGRALLWAGVTLGALAIVQVAYQGLDWMSATTTVSTEAYAATPVVELTTDGDVTVTVGDAGSVTVEQQVRSSFQQASHEVSESDDRLSVKHSCPQWWSNGVCRVDLTVQVPEGTAVVVRSGSGAVRAEGVGGDLDLRTMDGDVTVVRAGGSVEARSSSGRIEVDGSGADVVATTGDGGVTVRNAGGTVTAKSSSGRVLVDGATGDVSAITGDGDVEARAVLGSAIAKTSSGTVRVSGVSGDVEAITGDGPVVVRGTGTPVALQISTGDGRSTVEAPTDPAAARTVTIRSSSGDVSYLGAE